jgi:hypothetical protein
MCRFILLHHYWEKGKLMLALYDKKKHWFFTESVRTYRDKIAFYSKHGVEKGESYGEEEETQG